MRWLAVALLCLTACRSAWQRHDEVHYDAIRTPSAETALVYAELLKEIIDNAEAGGRRPPAGVCAEYAYYQARLGRLDLAEPWLAKEAKYYPEAQTFLVAMRRFLQGVQPYASTPGSEDSK